jgi:radical SAM superfamily enzyme YgiQ (UPF0313 family)
VVKEFQSIPEKRVLIVDDNLIGTRSDHIERAKELFRAMIKANLRKQWIAQVTINFADDEELLELAVKAGCKGVFIGFETPTAEGLQEIGKKYNLLRNREFKASVRRIQRHKIMVAGSFIIGLDTDTPGIGKRIAETANKYCVDSINVLFLTPLPGTRLWDQMKSDDRIILKAFPEDWKYYTLTFPVAAYRNLSIDGIIKEMVTCERSFYSYPRILKRVWNNLWRRRQPKITLVGNLSYRSNLKLNRRSYANFVLSSGVNRALPLAATSPATSAEHR